MNKMIFVTSFTPCLRAMVKYANKNLVLLIQAKIACISAVNHSLCLQWWDDNNCHARIA